VPEAGNPHVFSISADRSFADALVEGLIAQHGKDNMTLARGTILVPNNRAAMALQDAFVRQAEAGLLLPRLVPIGDADLGEHVGSALDPIDAEPILSAVEPLQRQMILAQMLQQEDTGLNGAQAMRLATELGRVLDQLIVERVSPAALQEFDVGDLSKHWATSIATLSVILDRWPTRLAELGRIDLSDRRNQQLDRVANRWRVAPPCGFVVAAGISSGAPAIAALVKTVSQMEHGQVVLAGLDLFMPPEEWDVIGGDGTQGALETHPQFHLWQLLSRIGVSRALVEPWRWGRSDKVRAVRGERVSLAMAPARFTQKWVGLPRNERHLTGITALELATPADEAQCIALALREAIEKPGKTAALVTPDRALAIRVSTLLARWDIRADDSGGRALSVTPTGTLLLALAAAAAEHFAPVALLALLKHPLVMSGEARLPWLDGVRALDLVLRGPRTTAGLSGIDARLLQPDDRTKELPEAAAAWWAVVRPELASFEAGSAGEPTLPVLLKLLRETAQSLAGDRLWAGQEGRAASQMIASLEEHAALGPTGMTAQILPLLLRDLMDGIAVRPALGSHSRLFIWGLLEAKLQTADLMILGGLNEGVWPVLSNPDPWLAPAVRRQLKLPSLERRIGLSSHDLVSAMGAKEVLLTRANRDARSPTIASRLWLRLETLAGGFESPASTRRYDLLARALDTATGERTKRPVQRPPVEERPRKISVTEVDGLKADPYSFYARKMLKLSKLAAPGEEPDAKWRGIFLHAVLGDWGQKDGFAVGALLPRLKAAFDDSALHPVVRAMWQPRFEEAAQWFEDRVQEERLEGRIPLKAEIAGKISIGDVTLSGRADRIDRLADGSLAIVDYKTGSPPSTAQVMDGFAMQLGLIAHMANCGAFEGAQGLPGLFEYWSQARKTGSNYGYVKSPNVSRNKTLKEPEDFVADAYRHFEEAVDDWLLGDKPFTAKERPEYAWSDYDQLMRYEEWQGRLG
jgi:ATP-dependent helicase/nuclease subunit B